MKNALASMIMGFSIVAAATVAHGQDGQGVGRGMGMMGMMGGSCATMGMMGQGGWGRGMMMGRQPNMGAMVEGRLAYLKSELNITAEKAAAWDTYASAVKGRVESMQGMHQSMINTMHDGTALERMDARISVMEAMLESMKDLKPATEGLYAALNDDQKKIADDLIGADCGAM